MFTFEDITKIGGQKITLLDNMDFVWTLTIGMSC